MIGRFFTFLFLAVVTFAGYIYFFGGYGAAARTYKRYATTMFKRSYEKGEKFILNDRTAESSYHRAKSFYETNYVRFRETPGYPHYVIDEQKPSETGKEVYLKIIQILPAQEEDMFSPTRLKFLAYRHSVQMVRQGMVWKIGSHSISPTRYEKTAAGKKKSGLSFMEDIKTILSSFSGRVVKPTSSRKKKEVVKMPSGSKSQGANVKTFHLKSGEVIQGEVKVDDDVYYSLALSDGSQRIVLKEDIASE